MQLDQSPPGTLRRSLLAATLTLLSTSSPAQQPAASPTDAEQPLQADAGLLYYKENQGRIQSYDAIVSLRKDFGDESILGLTGAFDSLSGGSPNGAVPTRAAQTFATPSGTTFQAASGAPVTYTTASGRTVAQLAKVTLYTVAPGQLPLDPNFRDQRIAADASWSQPFGSGNHFAVGGHVSHEHDFLSLSANGNVSRDFNSKNTTLGLGLSAEQDSVNPVGGVPLAGSDYTLLQKSGTSTKRVDGAQFSVTQVLTRTWIAQLNIAMDRSSGYLTDPYKIVSVVDASGNATGYRFESRPDSRTRRSAYLENKVALGSSVLDVAYRHASDDWGIASDTVEGRYRFNIGGEDMYLEPHLRWYRQSAADFYHLFVAAASPLPAYMSADPRLAAFTAKTVGVKFGMLLQDDQELTLRLEGYQQDPATRSSALPGLAGIDLNPALKSIVFQIDWHFTY